jgi:hypothetical protein
MQEKQYFVVVETAHSQVKGSSLLLTLLLDDFILFLCQDRSEYNTRVRGIMLSIEDDVEKPYSQGKKIMLPSLRY